MTDNLAEAVAGLYRCSDCDSTTALHSTREGVYVLTVHHDPTCPYLAGLECGGTT